MAQLKLVFRAELLPDPDGGLLVSFPDVPSALTHGETRDEALANASDALGLALRGYLADNEPLPQPAATEGVPIAIDPVDAAKIAVIDRFRKLGISKTELARRLGKAEGEARRILDPDHPSKMTQLQAALKAMGQTFVVSTMELA